MVVSQFVNDDAAEKACSARNEHPPIRKQLLHVQTSPPRVFTPVVRGEPPTMITIHEIASALLSSMTMYSRLGYRLSMTDLIVFSRNWPWLKDGVTTEIFGRLILPIDCDRDQQLA